MFKQEETKETLNDLPALGVSSVNCPVVSFASSVFIHHFCRVSMLHGDMSQSSCYIYLPSKDNISWFLGEWCKFTSKNNYKGVKYFHSHIMNPSCSLDAHIHSGATFSSNFLWILHLFHLEDAQLSSFTLWRERWENHPSVLGWRPALTTGDP